MTTISRLTNSSDIILGGGLARAAARFSPKSLADGAMAASGVMDTGQAFTTFASPTAPAPLAISGGRIAHTPFSGAQSAGYMQVLMPGRITRLGCEVSWPSSAVGVAALVVPSSPWASGVLPNAGFHFTTTGNAVWTLSRFTTGGLTTLADYTTYGRPTDCRGQGLVPLDVFFDPLNNKVVICWWDGSRTVVTNAFLGSETSTYGIWELFENNGATDVPAVFGDIWADDTTVRYDGAPTYGSITSPIRQVYSTGHVLYNASGTLNPDFTKCRVHEVTLVGNVTSMTFQNPPAPNETMELHLIQDATGSRTLAGANANIKWAGGAPTLTTTAAKRDVFTFRWNGSNFIELARSMNVG